MYIRYTQPPSDLYDWYEDYLQDEEEIEVKAGGGQVSVLYEDPFFVNRKECVLFYSGVKGPSDKSSLMVVTLSTLPSAIDNRTNGPSVLDEAGVVFDTLPANSGSHSKDHRASY